MNSKADYVRRQPHVPGHECHWPGCKCEVPPAMWGRTRHWGRLPKPLQDAIWAAYVPGQEITKRPSEEYVAVALLVQEWIAGRIAIRADGSVHPIPQALSLF